MTRGLNIFVLILGEANEFRTFNDGRYWMLRLIRCVSSGDLFSFVFGVLFILILAGYF